MARKAVDNLDLLRWRSLDAAVLLRVLSDYANMHAAQFKIDDAWLEELFVQVPCRFVACWLMMQKGEFRARDRIPYSAGLA